jgi:hypothetical protein
MTTRSRRGRVARNYSHRTERSDRPITPLFDRSPAKLVLADLVATASASSTARSTCRPGSATSCTSPGRWTAWLDRWRSGSRVVGDQLPAPIDASYTETVFPALTL